MDAYHHISRDHPPFGLVSLLTLDEGKVSWSSRDQHYHFSQKREWVRLARLSIHGTGLLHHHRLPLEFFGHFHTISHLPGAILRLSPLLHHFGKMARSRLVYEKIQKDLSHSHDIFSPFPAGKLDE